MDKLLQKTASVIYENMLNQGKRGRKGPTPPPRWATLNKETDNEVKGSESGGSSLPSPPSLNAPPPTEDNSQSFPPPPANLLLKLPPPVPPKPLFVICADRAVSECYGTIPKGPHSAAAVTLLAPMITATTNSQHLTTTTNTPPSKQMWYYDL